MTIRNRRKRKKASNWNEVGLIQAGSEQSRAVPVSLQPLRRRRAPAVRARKRTKLS